MGHLRQAGFTVETVFVQDVGVVKARYRVPHALRSCHTALVAGYVIEGHVPADVIDRLLHERPKIAGLAVPGMPIGSPGMEVPGQRAERYQVLAFYPDGRSTVYASR